MSAIQVVRAAVHTTVQDLGRPGFTAVGVPVAGALDPTALAGANRAVGNPAVAAGLECVLRGPTFLPDSDGWVAVVGAGWAVGPERLTAGVPYTVPLSSGLRCWVAVSGGIITTPVLSSRSTDTLSGLGGRPLRDGDVLPLGASGGPGPEPLPAPALPEDVVALRVLPGPHADRLHGGLDDRELTVSPATDRTGVRFLPLPGLAATGGEVATIPVLPGALQLPPGGGPILLLANCQTTGGYPVVGVVCAADLRLAAQLRPGMDVRLELIGREEARELAAQAAF